MLGWAFAGCCVREEERQILGWCVERGEVPACVAAVPMAAWSPDAEFLVRLLIELQSVDVQVGPLDLWWIAQQRAEGEIRRVLATWFALDDLLLLPQYAPWSFEEVGALCGLVAERYQARVAYAEALQAAEERAERARMAAMERGVGRLAAHWPDLGKGTAAVPLAVSRVHPGWLTYMAVG